MNRSFSIGALPLLLLISLSFSACSAEAKKNRAVKRADAYMESGDLAKAKIEYLNALREGPPDAAVLENMGRIWQKQGVPMEAYRFLSGAAKLKPNDHALHAEVAELLLGLGQFAEARKQALAILEADPANGTALKVVADSSRTPEEAAEAAQLLEKFSNRETAQYHLAAASVAFRRNDPPAAEAAVQAALASDPKSASAHSMMAALHLLQKRPKEAAQEIQTASELSPARSPERVNLASLKAQNKELPEAKRILDELIKEAPDYVPGLRARAKVAAMEQQHDEALKLLEKALAIHPDDFESHLLRGEVWLAQGDHKKAVEGLERLVEKYPAPMARYQLARAYLQAKDPQRATTALTQAITTNHEFTEAIVLLAQLDLRAGNAEAVVTAMENLLQKRPNLPSAELLLVDGYRALGRFDEAASLISKQIERAPDAVQPLMMLGIVQRQQNKLAEARQTFQKVLDRTPDNLAVVNQLVELDLQEKNFKAATERIAAPLAKTPEVAALQFLKGKVHAAQQQLDEAEAALQKAIELDSHFSAAYELLISIYVASKKLPKALEQLEAVLAQKPENQGALMLKALINEQMGEFQKARDAYEKLIALAPENPVALNNLAYLFAERLNEPDKALDLATKARTASPEEPSIADTLGWIQYKRGNYQQAQALLRESAGKLPDNAEVQYHLGMAAYMMGQSDAAKQALEKAVNAPGDFAGKQEARSRLALLTTSGGADLPVADLEAMVKQQPKDPLAQMRLADAYERDGAFQKAASAAEAALEANPKLTAAYLKLAQLHTGPLNESGKAMTYAKQARELSPDDPKIAATLGGIALESGNVAWGYNLLGETVRQLPKDPLVHFNLGLAAYLSGQLAEAEKHLKVVSELAPESNEATRAKTLLEMHALSRKPKEAVASANRIEGVLKKDPRSAAARMALASRQEEEGNAAGAIATYNEILATYPDFSFAQKELARILADDPAQSGKAYELAVKARRVLAEDLELARTLGKLRYLRKEYAAAVSALEAAAAQQALDSVHLYYLGMSYQGAGKRELAAKHLERSLQGGLKEPMAAEARKVLSSGE